MTRTNTMAKSRNTESRELNNRGQSMEYTEPNMLDIPETVTNRFRSEGMALRWIRINLRGKDDNTNVGKRVQEGWQFVDINEVPEIQHTSFVRDEGRYTGAVCRGDLALAKMPLAKAENRQKYYEEQSSNMVDAVNQQLMSGNNSRMPIKNNSKCQITKGKTPRFQD